MKIAPVAEVKARFSDYLKKSASSPVIVTKNGRPVAAIVGAPEDDDNLERFILANTPRFLKILEQAQAGIQKTGGVEHKEFWKEVKRRADRKSGSKKKRENKLPRDVK